MTPLLHVCRRTGARSMTSCTSTLSILENTKETKRLLCHLSVKFLRHSPNLAYIIYNYYIFSVSFDLCETFHSNATANHLLFFFCKKLKKDADFYLIKLSKPKTKSHPVASPILRLSADVFFDEFRN